MKPKPPKRPRAKPSKQRHAGDGTKLRVFVASSTEAVPHLRRVIEWINRTNRGHEVRPWTNPKTFVPGVSTWTSLHRIAGEVDAAIAIFAQDDKVKFRSKTMSQARDNAMVEYGLFAGRLGPDRTAFCAEKGVKIPSDVRGIGYIELPAKTASVAEARRKNALAAQKVDLWLQHVEKAALAKTPQLSDQELKRRIRTAEDVLMEAIFDGRRDEGEDTINTYAGELLVRDVATGLVPRRVTTSVELKIERNGDGFCRMREDSVFEGRDVSMVPFVMAGDSPVDDVRDLRAGVRSLTRGVTAKAIMAQDMSTRRTALLGFRPSVRAGKTLSYEVSWHWPAMWDKLIKGQEDCWAQEIEAKEPPQARVQVLINARLGKIGFDSRGDGKVVQRAERTTDGYRRYDLLLKDLNPTSSIKLALLPR